MEKINTDYKRRTRNISAKLFILYKSWRNSFNRNVRSLKCYQIFRITVIVKENYKHAGISHLVYHGIVQNFRLGWVFRRRYNHRRFSNAILPDQDSRQIHVATPNTTRSVSNWVLGISSKVHTSTNSSTWENNGRCTSAIQCHTE